MSSEELDKMTKAMMDSEMTFIERDITDTCECDCCQRTRVAERMVVELEKRIDILQLKVCAESKRANMWAAAVRDVAISCGMPPEEERTTRYLRYICAKLEG